MSKKALEQIQKNRESRDEKLDLSGCKIKELPQELIELVWVRNLDIYENEISDLSAITNLKNLVSLSCSNNQISDLKPLSELTNLINLSFDYNKVTDLNPISKLVKLISISCSDNEITNLDPISKLVNLSDISFSNNKIKDLRPITNLTKLTWLSCDSNKICDLMYIKNLINLTWLHCSHNPIKDLNPIGGLSKLTYLYCSDCQINDLKPISKLFNLTHLDCGSNQINDLSPLAKLNKLTDLSCDNNQISNLRPIAKHFNLTKLLCGNNHISDLNPMAKLDKLTLLNYENNPITNLSMISNLIHNNISVKWQSFSEYFLDNENLSEQFPAILVKNCPLICPPLEIAQHSSEAVRDYFEELGQDGSRLNEVKIIFLGEASAGKTSLVKRLMNEPFNSMESQTHGIRIRKVPFFMDDREEVITHLWDFGGQEVMHATHQFFLSQRSVYVLLLNSRNDDQAEKWLKHAASFGGNSPVLVVLNKIDENPSFEVERKTLQEKYPQIKGFYRISCKNEKGLADFKEALRQEIDQATTRLTPFPKHWLDVKEHFSNMQANYIESAEYQKICEALGVNRQVSQDVLLQFLHDLGVVINFRKLQYFDTQILNPLWLTNGVYRIINSQQVVDNAGILHERNFDAVINDPRYQKNEVTDRQYIYPKNKLHYIVRVMEEFELCFSLDNQSYVIPQLLTVNAPEWQPEGAKLQFVIDFSDFLPDSIFPRLMVKLHNFIQGDQRWRTGMILHKPNVFKAIARVRWDKEDKKILIEVCGEERRRFLSFIRETLKEISNDFTKLNYKELVPIPNSKEFLVYEGLVKAEQANKKEIYVWQVDKELKVADLLDGVEEASMRDEREQLQVNAFVSYAHQDLKYLKELKTALAPLVRLQKLKLWDDREINAGTEWEEEINLRLEQADIVICLISADFIASDFCFQKQFEFALEAHQKNKKIIIPVLLRQTDWKDLPIAKLKGIPDQWITSSVNRDEAWTKVSEHLRPLLSKIKKERPKKGLGRPRLVPLDEIRVDPNLPPLK